MRRLAQLVVYIGVFLLIGSLSVSGTLADPNAVAPRSRAGLAAGEDAPVASLPLMVTDARAAAGTPAAIAIESPTPSRAISIRIEGIIASIVITDGIQLWTIEGISFLVTPQTTIISPAHTPAVGDQAVVYAVREDATITARRIYIRPPDDTSWLPIEFRGVITELPADPFAADWRVGGVYVKVDSKATVVSGAPPRRGFYAQVAGVIEKDRRVLATTIVVLDPAVVSAEFAFEGTIQQMPTGTSSQWIVGGIRGTTNVSTTIEGSPAVGAVAEVTGRRLNGALYFSRIRARTAEESEVRLVGPITEIRQNSDYNATWTIEDRATGSRQVEVDGTAFVDESRARAAVGMNAEVIARSCVGHLLCAMRIRVTKPI